MNDRHNRNQFGKSQGSHGAGRRGGSGGQGRSFVRDDSEGSEATSQREGSNRGAPPDATGAETNYLVKNMQAKTPVVIKLMDNQEFHGWIEYYDRNVIKLNRAIPPHLFIRKDTIKYIYKDEDAVRGPSRDDR